MSQSGDTGRAASYDPAEQGRAAQAAIDATPLVWNQKLRNQQLRNQQLESEPAIPSAHRDSPTEARDTEAVPGYDGSGFRPVFPNLVNAIGSLLSILICALFVITFIAQPFRIPSGSMKQTLLVGDFLLVNKSIFGPPGHWGWLLPYTPVTRDDIVVFHFPVNPGEDLVKRIVAVPGDRIRMDGQAVYVNGARQYEPYAYFEKSYQNAFSTRFPSLIYTDPGVNMRWWERMGGYVHNGWLLTPAGSYFALGDNRNDSRDSRYWGFVPRANIVGMPFLIYFSLNEGSGEESDIIPDDRLGHGHDIFEQILLFARWNRILRVVH